MPFKKKEFKLTPSHYKVLETVDYLNKLKYYPLPSGIHKIIKGEKDDETIQFKECPTYGTIISFSSKKVCRLVMMLVRYNYLEKIYDRNTNELYLKISNFGSIELIKYLKKHKINHTKKSANVKPSIVKID